MKKFNSFILLILLLLNISSCGFQPRGINVVNFETISINGGSSSFTKLLKKKFKQSGVKIQEKNSEKTLEITNDTFSKKILSLSATGKVREYQINYTASFRFKSKDKEWGDLITLDVSREFSFDDKNIIAKTKEESRLIKGMKDQIILTIVNQISVIK
jgi:LPS-assembly lipoprotein